MPMLPAPATISTSLYPLMYLRSLCSDRAYSRASPMCAPCWMMLAPNLRHLSTLVMGATVGMTHVTGMPRSLPCQARAKAWLPALAVMTPLRFSSSLSSMRLLRPPRSLKLPVNCIKSFFRYTLHSHSSDKNVDKLQCVRRMPLAMR